jgi:hypothetical protein
MTPPSIAFGVMPLESADMKEPTPPLAGADAATDGASVPATEGSLADEAISTAVVAFDFLDATDTASS